MSEPGDNMTRQCAYCGQQKAADEYVHRRARCRDCQNEYRRTWFKRNGQAQQADRARTSAIKQRQQEATLTKATNSGDPWDAEQDAVIVENWHKPLTEVASILNRTYQSVHNRKKKLNRWGLSPRKDGA